MNVTDKSAAAEARFPGSPHGTLFDAKVLVWYDGPIHSLMKDDKGGYHVMVSIEDRYQALEIDRAIAALTEAEAGTLMADADMGRVMDITFDAMQRDAILITAGWADDRFIRSRKITAEEVADWFKPSEPRA